MSYAIFVKNHIHETIIDNTIDKCIFDEMNNTNVELCDDKLFANSICLKDHIRIIHNRKYFYKCDECEKTTKTANELFIHISYRHRQSSIRLFDCEKCGKSFKSMSNMKHHIDSFHSNNPNKCQCNNVENISNRYIIWESIDDQLIRRIDINAIDAIRLANIDRLSFDIFENAR